MKILGLVCSPRKDGNTEILVREALSVAREAGCETDIFLVADKNIAPCDGCMGAALGNRSIKMGRRAALCVRNDALLPAYGDGLCDIRIS